jgi:hypothetical protein
MKWPRHWWRRRNASGIEEAKAALAAAEARDWDVARVVAQTEWVVRRNNFAPRFAAAMSARARRR